MTKLCIFPSSPQSLLPEASICSGICHEHTGVLCECLVPQPFLCCSTLLHWDGRRWDVAGVPHTQWQACLSSDICLENISLEPGGVVRLQRHTWTSTANSVGPSSAAATALTRATQPRLLQIDSWLWQFTLVLDKVHLCTSLFLCGPALIKVFPSNKQRKWNLLCWFDLIKWTETLIDIFSLSTVVRREWYTSILINLYHHGQTFHIPDLEKADISHVSLNM